MKKIFILVVASVTQICIGQNVFPETGNVGVGIANPDAILDVYSPLPIPNTYNSQKWSSRNENYNLMLKTTWDDNGINQAFIQKFDGVNYNSLVFFGGKVGIGTLNPFVKLDVISDDVSAFFRSTSNLVPVSIINQGASISTIGFKGSTSVNEYNVRVGADGNDFISYTNNLERVRITSDGNVGIGIINPEAILDVYSPLPNPSTYNTQRWSSRSENYHLTLKTTWDNNGINQRFVQRFNNVDYNSLVFFGGNVGIGKLNPSNKLDVNGTIHSQEVKVDMTGWSDFVFKKGYKLPTLEQVENHIKGKGHLENIPSEEEVMRNGINLGEMNVKLLQKVEELTLYMIEQNKRLDKVEQENAVLKKQIHKSKK